MQIKPIIERIKTRNYFAEVKFSKNLPNLDDIKQSKLALPMLYYLPVKGKGGAISSKSRPRQQIGSMYSFVLVTKAGDENCINEPQLTEARSQLMDALIGFSIGSNYEPMMYSQGQILDQNTKINLWVEEYDTDHNHQPQP